MSRCNLPKLTTYLMLLLLAGCGSSSDDRLNADPHASQSFDSNVAETDTMKLTSTAFDYDAAILEKYTGVGEDISPPLAWSNAPKDTKAFALICDDPDAPSRAKPRREGPWVHWVIYNIPSDTTELPASVPREAEPDRPAGAVQGRNDFGTDNIGYRGPMPPPGSGPHRYFFKIYALDKQLDLAAADANKKSLLAAMQGHILAQGQLVGTFERD